MKMKRMKCTFIPFFYSLFCCFILFFSYIVFYMEKKKINEKLKNAYSREKDSISYLFAYFTEKEIFLSFFHSFASFLIV